MGTSESLEAIEIARMPMRGQFVSKEGASAYTGKTPFSWSERLSHPPIYEEDDGRPVSEDVRKLSDGIYTSFILERYQLSTTFDSREQVPLYAPARRSPTATKRLHDFLKRRRLLLLSLLSRALLHCGLLVHIRVDLAHPLG